MSSKYTAKLYFEVIKEKSGDDLEQLSFWIANEATEHSEYAHGEIIDNKSHKVVKKFQRSPTDE